MINLNLSSISHGKVGSQESVDLDIAHVAVGTLVLDQLQGTLHLMRVDDGVTVTGVLKARAKTECTRCLTPFFEPITIELEDTLSLPGAEITEERPVRISGDGWADFAPLVREYTWLGLPPSPICSPDCLGICPHCGENRNLGECACGEADKIDPRWEVLRELVEDSD